MKGSPFEHTTSLEPIEIRAKRLPLTEHEVLTDKGRLEMAEQRFLSPMYRVTFGPLSQIAGYYTNFLSILSGWHPNEAEAMTLYYDHERRRMTREMDDWAHLGGMGDAKEAKELKRITFQFRQMSIDGLYIGRRPH